LLNFLSVKAETSQSIINQDVSDMVADFVFQWQ